MLAVWLEMVQLVAQHLSEAIASLEGPLPIKTMEVTAAPAEAAVDQNPITGEMEAMAVPMGQMEPHPLILEELGKGLPHANLESLTANYIPAEAVVKAETAVAEAMVVLEAPTKQLL